MRLHIIALGLAIACGGCVNAVGDKTKAATATFCADQSATPGVLGVAAGFFPPPTDLTLTTVEKVARCIL